MARVDTVEDRKSGIKVHINLDKKTMLFSAEFADWKFSDKDGELVRSEALKAIRDRVDLVWVPVIWAYQEHNHSIEYGHDHNHLPLDQHQTMGLKVDRFYAARKFDGWWVRVAWDVEPAQRLNHTRGWRDIPKDATEITYTSHNGTFFEKANGTYILPYSDELWNGLSAVIAQMRRIRQMIQDLLGNEDGIQRLIEVGSGGVPLLNASSDADRL